MDGGVVYAYGSGTLRVTSSARGFVAVLQDVYYAPGIHARLASLGKLCIKGGRFARRKAEWDRDGPLFANVEMANNVYPLKLDVVHLKLRWPRGLWRVARQNRLPMSWLNDLEGLRWSPRQREPMAGRHRYSPGTDGWVIRLSRPWSHRQRKGSTVVTDLPTKIPALDACAACVAAKSVHVPHKEGRNRARE